MPSLPQNVGNFIHCTAIFQAISFSIRFSIFFSFFFLFCPALLFFWNCIFTQGRRRRRQCWSRRLSQSSVSEDFLVQLPMGRRRRRCWSWSSFGWLHLWQQPQRANRDACFDTGELNTIVQYLFNVNEKRQTRQQHGGKGTGKGRADQFDTVLRSYIYWGGSSRKWYWTLCRCESLSLSLSVCECVCGSECVCECVCRVPNVPMHSSKLKLEIKCLRSTKILNEKVIAFPSDLRGCSGLYNWESRGMYGGIAALVTYQARMCVCLELHLSHQCLNWDFSFSLALRKFVCFYVFASFSSKIPMN